MTLDCGGCGTTMAEGARFCPQCGTARPVAGCASCGAPSTGGRFCDQCGAPSGAAPEAPTASTRPGRVAERRLTSVLFGDLVGFTTLSESRDPEEVRELLSEYFEVARTVVARYGGAIEKFIGDAVMAVWGVPTANEDDAERSVRAGLDLVAAVAALGDQVGAPGLAMRVGVVTGEVAVTLGATSEGMVAGDAVNTAARVQSAALPGTVWVDDATRSLTAAAVDYVDVGEHDMKGKALPVRLFQAQAVVASVGGAQRVDGLEAPFTGRDRQLRLVKELCHETSEEGRPRLVLVTGVAGVGKSRLAWEFEKYIDGLSSVFAWHRGRCLSYGEGIAFWALAEVVRARLGLTETDPPSVVSERLTERLPLFLADAAERDWVQPRLAVLLSTDSSRTFAREDLFAAWVRFLECAGAGNPVIVVLDDLQHADEALLDFLDHLLATGSGAVHVLALARPELLDRRPALGSHRRVTVLHLEPLGAPAMAELVDGLVEGLTPAAREALVARADGNPLFAVETVRALIDRDLVVPSEGRYVLAPGAAAVDVEALGAPASLHALVASRLDALPAAERHVMSTASILGLSFPRTAVLALNPDDHDLDAHLDALVRRELLTVQNDRFAADHGHLRFVQAVVRQVAYETLSRRDRRAGHLAAATQLENEPNAEELSALIARHLMDAVAVSSDNDPESTALIAHAVRLLEQAAERATRLAAFREALRHYSAALACHPDGATALRLHERAAAAARSAGEYATALQHTDAVLTALPDLGDGTEPDAVRAACCAVIAGQSLNESGRLTEAVALLRAHLLLLPDTTDAQPVTLDLLSTLARSLLYMGDSEQAQPVQDQQLRLAERLGDPVKLADAWMNTAMGMGGGGLPATALNLMQGAVDLGRAGDDPTTVCRVLSNLTAFGSARDLRGALGHAREAHALSTRTPAYWRHVSGLNLTLSLHMAGAWSECAAVLEDLLDPTQETPPFLAAALAIQLWQELARDGEVSLAAAPKWDEEDDGQTRAWLQQIVLVLATCAGDLAAAARAGAASLDVAVPLYGIDDDFPRLWVPAVLASLNAGLFEQAAQQIALVADAPPGFVTPLLLAQLPRLQGMLTAAREGDPEPHLRRAIDALGAYGAAPDVARTQQDLATWLLGQGRGDEAQPLIASAHSTYQALGALAWLKEVEALSAQDVTVMVLP